MKLNLPKRRCHVGCCHNGHQAIGAVVRQRCCRSHLTRSPGGCSAQGPEVIGPYRTELASRKGSLSDIQTSFLSFAGVAKLVNAEDLKSSAERFMGSSPITRIIFAEKTCLIMR